MIKEEGLRIWDIIIFLVVIAAGCYSAYSYFQGKTEEKSRTEARKTARQERVEAIRVAVVQLASKYNAVSDWEDNLFEERSGKKRKKELIFTAEMENAWVINSPILFKGEIKDVSTLDANNYLLALDGQLRSGTQLALNLKAPKSMINSFMRANPSAYRVRVAVIAKISKISTNYHVAQEGYGEEKSITEEKTITGVGECMDIILYSESHY